jgi:hypothetical protein
MDKKCNCGGSAAWHSPGCNKGLGLGSPKTESREEMKTTKVSFNEYKDATNNYRGWCTVCKEFTRDNTEPDIRPGEPGYDCPVCEENTVMGAEDAMITGHIWFEDPDEDKEGPEFKSKAEQRRYEAGKRDKEKRKKDGSRSLKHTHPHEETEKKTPIVLNEQSMAVLRTASKDENRPHLSGIFLDPDGSMVSTDGHRLSHITRPENAPIDLEAKPLESGKGVLLPRGNVEGMAKDLKGQRKSNIPLTQYITYEGTGRFERRDTMGVRQYQVHPLEDHQGKPAKFPPYKEVIPKSDPEDRVFSVNIDYLLDMARQAKEFMRGSPKPEYGCQAITFHIRKGELEPVRTECRHKETGQVLTHIIMPLRL